MQQQAITWWDSDCQPAKVNKYFLLRKFRLTDSAIDLHNYKAAKARFKNVCRSKGLHFEKGKRTELLNASRNPREYWKTVKLNCDKKSNLRNLISTENRVNYLKKLLNIAARSENEHLL